MGGTQRTFSQNPSDNAEQSNELTELGGSIDPVGRLIDTLASIYHWTIEYILDQPYTKLRELLNSIKFREYMESIKLFRLHNLAQGGDQRQVEQFFEQLKPKIAVKVKSEEGGPSISYEAMNLSGFNYVRKE